MSRTLPRRRPQPANRWSSSTAFHTSLPTLRDARFARLLRPGIGSVTPHAEEAAERPSRSARSNLRAVMGRTRYFSLCISSNHFLGAAAPRAPTAGRYSRRDTHQRLRQLVLGPAGCAPCAGGWRVPASAPGRCRRWTQISARVFMSRPGRGPQHAEHRLAGVVAELLHHRLVVDRLVHWRRRTSRPSACGGSRSLPDLALGHRFPPWSEASLAGLFPAGPSLYAEAMAAGLVPSRIPRWRQSRRFGQPSRPRAEKDKQCT